MAHLTNIITHADKNARATNAYWTVRGEAANFSNSFLLMSDCNNSLGDHSHGDFVKALVCSVFNHDETELLPVDGLYVEFTHSSFGKQSGTRYMNPTNEGYVKLTVKSKGIFDEGRGWYVVEQFDLKFFIMHTATKADFEKAVESLLSPIALTAWQEHKRVEQAA
ncbi:hypothetical protein [Reinekea sp. G2M2-21]|uniref:hypothetical protein n=1 Tax=Reinekea sp. G2M2-21 TaxID=2788942 RepID=UPI0018AB7627|nr:hypothetical protein [Reinekea sp. G2M2-21]